MNWYRCHSHAVVVLIVVATLSGGCGRHPVHPIPVHGRITLGGGNWPKPGRLYFTSQPNPNMPTRPGFALFDVEGHFKATTIHPGDGLLPGEYRVHVACWDVPPTMENPAGKSCVPANYRSAATSSLELVVKSDESMHEANFDVPKEQP
jgi:hypothetical protein